MEDTHEMFLFTESFFFIFKLLVLGKISQISYLVIILKVFFSLVTFYHLTAMSNFI